MTLFLWNKKKSTSRMGWCLTAQMVCYSAILCVILFVIFWVLAVGNIQVVAYKLSHGKKIAWSKSDQVRFNMSLKVQVICSCFLKITVFFSKASIYDAHVQGNSGKLESSSATMIHWLPLPLLVENYASRKLLWIATYWIWLNIISAEALPICFTIHNSSLLTGTNTRNNW